MECLRAALMIVIFLKIRDAQTKCSMGRECFTSGLYIVCRSFDNFKQISFQDCKTNINYFEIFLRPNIPVFLDDSFNFDDIHSFIENNHTISYGNYYSIDNIKALGFYHNALPLPLSHNLDRSLTLTNFKFEFFINNQFTNECHKSFMNNLNS